jgi:uncharacterized protein (DUF433 family)
MMAVPEVLTLPVHLDEEGVIRVGGTRVTLDVILACYHMGDSPESIQAGFPSVSLRDIYAVIAYYLDHQAEVDVYLADQAKQGELIRQKWEQDFPSSFDLEKKLRSKKKRADDACGMRSQMNPKMLAASVPSAPTN